MQKQINIVDFIPVGSENSISRAELCRITGIDDRTVRDLIARARETTCICNGQSERGGYYLPETIDEANRFYAQERKRALSILKRLRGTKEFIRQEENKKMYNQSFI